MTPPDLKIFSVHPDAREPQYATPGSAAFDLHSVQRAEVHNLTPSVTIRTGLVFHVPAGWQLKVYSRSGMGFNYNVRLGNCVGIIDSDYRQELLVKLTLDDMNGAYLVNVGDRIAQAQLEPVWKPHIEMDWDHSWNASEFTKGRGGFGSTGR